MIITQETHFAGVESQNKSLISTACAVVESDGYLVFVINVLDKKTEQICSSSFSEGGKSYTFADPDTDYNLTTEVKFEPENEREKSMLDGSVYSQYERGQFVFKFLPWTTYEKEEILGSIGNDENI